jgi:hypothetical protein
VRTTYIVRRSDDETWDDSALYNSKLLNDEYYWTCMHLKSPASHTAINSVRTSVIVRKILTWGQLAINATRTKVYAKVVG